MSATTSTTAAAKAAFKVRVERLVVPFELADKLEAKVASLKQYIDQLRRHYAAEEAKFKAQIYRLEQNNTALANDLNTLRRELLKRSRKTRKASK